jgi:hypothetical protein
MIANDSSAGAAEHIAYKLLQHIASVEQRSFFPNPGGDGAPADRKWILDTYAECLCAVKAEQRRRST